MSYDKDGHRYDLPIFVIHPPDEFKKTGPISQFRITQVMV